MVLAIKHRPGTWAAVVGQDKTVARLQQLRDGRGFGGRAYWITGASGTGKTTVAQLIARDLADDSCIEELDASTLTPADVQQVERSAAVRGWGLGGRVWIVNEAHALRKAVIRQLLVFLERLPSHVAVIFTTTTDGAEALFEDCADASPLTSRCLPVALARRDLAKPFAALARSIALAEGLASADIPEARWIRLVQDHKNNLRAVLQAIDAGEML